MTARSLLLLYFVAATSQLAASGAFIPRFSPPDARYPLYEARTSEDINGLPVDARYVRLRDADSATLQSLKRLKSLTHLDMSANVRSRNRLDDKGLAIIASIETITSLSLENCSRLAPNGLSALAAMSQLKRLDLSGVENSDPEREVMDDAAWQDFLPKLSLNRLDIEGFRSLGRVFFSCLAGQKSLDTLTFRGCGLHHDHHTSALLLAELPALRTLCIVSCHSLARVALGTVIRKGRLTNLALSRVKDLSAESLSDIKSLKELEFLELEHWPQLDNAVLRAVGRLGKLRGLSLCLDEQARPLEEPAGWSYAANAEGFAAIAALPLLETLILDRNPYVDDDWLVQLPGKTRLADLSLQGCPSYSAAGLKNLKHCTTLKGLNLSYHRGTHGVDTRKNPNLTPQLICAILPIGSLEVLAVDETEVLCSASLAVIAACPLLRVFSAANSLAPAGSDFSVLGTCKSLKHINLGGTTVSDTDIAGWEKLLQLEVLSLACCPKVSNASVPLLGRLKALRQLAIWGTGIDVTGTAALRKLLPDTNIY